MNNITVPGDTRTALNAQSAIEQIIARRKKNLLTRKEKAAHTRELLTKNVRHANDTYTRFIKKTSKLAKHNQVDEGRDKHMMIFTMYI